MGANRNEEGSDTAASISVANLGMGPNRNDDPGAIDLKASVANLEWGPTATQPGRRGHDLQV